MTALVKSYLNIRTDQPVIEIYNNPGYYSPGEHIEILGPVFGQPYKGNPIWYRLTNNAFVWSGGVDGVEFAWDETSFQTLTPQQQYNVLLLAKDYYSEKMLSDEYGVTGIFIGKKVIENREAACLSLCFQVMQKGDNVSWKKIPAQLPFKGYSISTDVVEEDFMEIQFKFPGDACSGKPGGSVSRMNREDWGSCAFIAEQEVDGFTNFYLVTNYHVAAFDLLLQEQFNYDVSKHDKLLPLVMPSWQFEEKEENKIGFLYKGLFSEWHDTALIRIPDETKISNSIFSNLKISGALDVIDDESFIGASVAMYGGFSGEVKNKKITSVNSTQRTRVGNRVFIKSELIQVERMSSGGDSGSPVLIGDQLIGIVIGADKHNTYVLSAIKILNFFNLKISDI